MTYTLRGNQYLVLAAGGHGKLGTKQGYYFLAFALP
jgi:quinoprotein glucose dehydrogenase